MCPMCLIAAAWIAAGTCSTGGLALLLARKLRVSKSDSLEREPEPPASLFHWTRANAAADRHRNTLLNLVADQTGER